MRLAFSTGELDMLSFAWSGSYKVLHEACAILQPMWGRQSAVVLVVAGLALGIASCAPVTVNAPVAISQKSTTEKAASGAFMPRAGRMAQGLAQAEMAYDQGAKARLGEIVNSLSASGLVPRDEAQTDLLNKWADASGGIAQPYRGRLLGPAYVRGELAPGERWISAQTFKSGEPSTLAVSHKGTGPVSISVSDQSARSVCNTGTSNPPSCRFTPLYTQRYSIELVNEGPERAVYFLVFD